MAKNVVLLSDGTGNSAAKLFKTNVRRLYGALDVTDPDRQVAYYADGVGTSSFKPLGLLLKADERARVCELAPTLSTSSMTRGTA